MTKPALPPGVVRLVVGSGANERRVDIRPPPAIRPPHAPDDPGPDIEGIAALANSLRRALHGSDLGYSVVIVPAIAAAKEGAVSGTSPHVVETAQRINGRFSDALILAPHLVPTLIKDPTTWEALSVVSRQDAIAYGYAIAGDPTPEVQPLARESLAPLCTVRNEPIFLYDVLRSEEAIAQLEALHASAGEMARRLATPGADWETGLQEARQLLSRTTSDADLVAGALSKIVRNVVGGHAAQIEVLEIDLEDGALRGEEMAELAALMTRLQQSASEVLAGYEQVKAIGGIQEK